MPKITRTTQKIFGINANSNSITAFGTAKDDSPIYTKDPAVIQNANFLKGWSDAIEEDKAPFEEDSNGLYLAITSQLAYLMQSGIAEWDSGTTYYAGDFCKGVGTGKIYISKGDSNTNHAVSDENYWEEYLTAELNNKANIDGSNMNASVKNFDGQWVEAFAELSTSNSVGTYNINLSSYLPSDSYAYEVLVGCEMYTDGISKLQSISSSIITTFVNVNHTESYADGSVGTCILPIGTDRMLYYKISNNGGGTCRLKLNAYRRIGTNS